MNIKRAIFWASFIIVLGLIVWGLSVAMNKPQPGSTVGSPSPVSADDHILGPKDAQVTLLEFGDFQCPACGAYFQLVKKLSQEASTTMRVVFRHFPLPQHANAMITAQAAEAAALQGKFWEMYDLIYDHQADWSDSSKTRDIMYGYAESLRLDIVKFKADIDSASIKERIARDEAEARRIGINGTPTFFVNGKAISNPQGYAAFKTLIEAAATSGSK